MTDRPSPDPPPADRETTDEGRGSSEASGAPGVRGTAAAPTFVPPAGAYTDWSADDLERAVRYYDHVYWVDNRTEIPDERYDRYVQRLKELRPDSPVLEQIGPARAAAAELGALGDTVVHAAPMLSLDKAYTEEELGRWAQAFEGDVVVSPKVDGVAASLRYGADGRLQIAATRGDGERGEDFTANARLVPDIPGDLADRPAFDGPIEVRGEVYMKLSVFARHAEEAANPRNLTAGTIKRKQASREQLGDLSFFAYDLLGADLPTEWEKLQRLEALGFRTVSPQRIAKADLQPAFASWLARRDALDYETDGVVFKADDVAEQQRLGATAHHPRYALAYKFQGDSDETTLTAVKWSVARTGVITPVAHVDPVLLSGARVSRCSLHNLNVLRRLGLNSGDTVTVTRRGGVIPHVEASLGGGDEPVEPPSTCPVCQEPTSIDEDTLSCSRPEACPGVQRRALEHFVKALDIDGLGEKLLAQLFESGRVNGPADFFTLEPAHLLEMELVGDVLAAKLVSNIAAARTMPLARFLVALGLPGLGSQTAKAVAAEFRTLEDVRAADVERLQSVPGLGRTVASGVRAGLERLARLVADLTKVIEVVPADASAGGDSAPAGPLTGRSVVFTGKLATMKRKDAQEMVVQAGGETPASVTKDLDMLVIGDDGSPLLGAGAKSSKHEQAEAYNESGSNIEIVSEADFLRKLGVDRGASAPDAPPEKGQPEQGTLL